MELFSRRWLVLVLPALLVLSAGCGQEKLTILCGGSFRPPMEELVAAYEKETGEDVELSFGQSEDHWPHVEMHESGDVFVSHTPFMQKTKDADALTRYVSVGYIAPVLVVKPGNPKDIHSIEDLTKPGLKVVLTNPQYSSCGEMVFALLEKKGIKDAVLANVGNAQVKTHPEVATAIVTGDRDAGIMWNGVADSWLDRGELEIVPTPYEYERETEVGVMGLSYSKRPEQVERFLKFVEKHGKEIFAANGYVKEVQAQPKDADKKDEGKKDEGKKDEDSDEG